MPTFGRRMREEVLDRITAENPTQGAELAELRHHNPQAYRKALRKWGRAHHEEVAWRPSLASTADVRSTPEAALEVGEGPEGATVEVAAPQVHAKGESPAEARARLEAEQEARRAEAEAAQRANEEEVEEEKPKAKRGKKADAPVEPEAPAEPAETKPKGKAKKKG